jgi:imidazoleglycerol-phosphate dehydratase/histidinol-phosphatase
MDGERMKIAFVDRDGTLIEEPADEQVDTPEKYRLLPGVGDGLKRLMDAGYSIVVVTNQDGLGLPQYPRARFDAIQERMLADLTREGVVVRDTLVCPHLPAGGCECRKPKLGLLTEYLNNPQVDWPACCVVGDRDTDVQLAQSLGARPIKVSRNLEKEGSWNAILEMIAQAPQGRVAATHRKTKETDIQLRLNLDGHGVGVVKTGLHFFDHMLTAMLHHASIDYWLFATGDLQVDEHHTIEDVAIVLGDTLAKTLGERRGVMRFGFLLPMDDALAQVAIDLGGRPYCVFKAKFDREVVGDLPTDMIEHFFHTLAMQLKANIHIDLKYSSNTHHAVEAVFKAVGRALRMACDQDPRNRDQVASTKGVL